MRFPGSEESAGKQRAADEAARRNSDSVMYAIERGNTLRSIGNRAGGLTTHAFRDQPMLARMWLGKTEQLGFEADQGWAVASLKQARNQRSAMKALERLASNWAAY
jgi:hypothetical protein